MADISQVCRRQGFQDLDLPPFQNNVGVVRVDRCVVTSRSSQYIKILIDKKSLAFKWFLPIDNGNGWNLSRD